MNARWTLVIVAMAAAPQGIHAQTGELLGRYVDRANGLTLEDAIRRAVRDEPSLRAARGEIERAEGMRIQAALRPNPSLSTERRQEPGGTDTQTSVSIEWPLDLFRRAGRVAVADRELEATRASVEDRERLLVSEVRAAYGELLAAIRTLSVTEDLVGAIRRQLSVLRSRVQEGAAPALERDLLDVELRRMESELALRTGRVDARLFELKRLLGLSAGTPVMVRETLEEIVSRDRPVAVVAAEQGPAATTDAVLQRADVRQAAAEVRVAEARVDRAERDSRFDVNLFGGYMRMDAGFPQSGFAPGGHIERVRGQFNYLSAGARVMLPLRDRKQGEVAASEAARGIAESRRAAAELAAQAEVAAARIRDERARQALALYTGGTQALARQNLSVVTQTYEFGRATVFDVLAEQRRYLDLEGAYTEALREAYDARTALRRAAGDVR